MDSMKWMASFNKPKISNEPESPNILFAKFISTDKSY